MVIMSTDILMSIKPKWCELIFSGQKIDEIRLTKPQWTDGWKYTVYVWQTGGGGIVGRFIVRKYTFIQAWIDRDGEKHLGNTFGLRHCVDDEELFEYLFRKGKTKGAYPGGWAWRIEEAEKFEKPWSLSVFGLKRPPQSWQYVNFI